MPAIIIMGPSGCGKSTLGKALADHLGWEFVEGDELHPPENIGKMTAGIPLNDFDREPFLRNVANELYAKSAVGVVAACSALKQVYREQIRKQCPDTLFILPPSNREHLLNNMKARGKHFMPTKLIDSQLNDLEIPTAKENALLLSQVETIEDAINTILEFLGRERLN